MKVCVVMDNGFEELEAMGPIALMRRAGLDVDLVGIEKDAVTGRFGVTYSPVIPIDTYDFSGKTIAPFCTSGGSGISEAVSGIEELEPDADIVEGLRTTTSEAEDDIAQWLESTGLAQ